MIQFFNCNFFQIRFNFFPNLIQFFTFNSIKTKSNLFNSKIHYLKFKSISIFFKFNSLSYSNSIQPLKFNSFNSIQKHFFTRNINFHISYRALNGRYILKPLPKDIVLVLQSPYLLLQYHASPLSFEILARSVKKSSISKTECLSNRQRYFLSELVAHKYKARVPLRILLLRYKTEELLLALVIGTVRNSMQRILMHNSLQFKKCSSLNLPLINFIN